MAGENKDASRSVAAIVGLVLGILAVVLSWMPIINNFAFVLGGIGLVFAVVGMVGVVRGKKAGKALAIAALVVNIASLAVVLGTQSMYSSALDDAANGPDVTATDAAQAAGDDADRGDAADTDAVSTQDLGVGSSVTFEDGVTLTLDSVEPGLTNYDGSPVIGIHVTYVNNGDAEFDYNSYNWKGRDAQGAATDPVYYSEAVDELSYGTLAAGGTVSGSVYFEGDSVSALYYASIIAGSPAASWTIA